MKLTGEGSYQLLRDPEQSSPAFRRERSALRATPTSSGSARQFFQGPTATLDNLDIHVTTLNHGQTSHPPHQHLNEELVIVKEGTVEFFTNGEWKKAEPGSVIFIAQKSPQHAADVR